MIEADWGQTTDGPNCLAPEGGNRAPGTGTGPVAGRAEGWELGFSTWRNGVKQQWRKGGK